MRTLITYDIDKKHIEVKKEMKKKGYEDFWLFDNKYVYLPNTTLWINSNLKTCAQAIKDIKEIIASLQVKLERCVAVEFQDTSWYAIYGEKHIE